MLAETKVYDNPPGGHRYDRRVDSRTWQPENTPEQRDSWRRAWSHLDRHLDPPTVVVDTASAADHR